jgi:hypothetical protein
MCPEEGQVRKSAFSAYKRMGTKKSCLQSFEIAECSEQVERIVLDGPVFRLKSYLGGSNDEKNSGSGSGCRVLSALAADGQCRTCERSGVGFSQSE